ncbi:SgcJ/EcaC family oxidoreductase [Kitasatospora sp. NPDC001540]|uniref:SgcJ/EcaC family oxidoreductase n=1 Tax=Kitasatospora sp. NPDC001540 TaxID=3364014 RepID=UPI0036A8EF87
MLQADTSSLKHLHGRSYQRGRHAHRHHRTHCPTCSRRNGPDRRTGRRRRLLLARRHVVRCPRARRAVRSTLRPLTDAWGRGDAAGYGEQFTAAATYTTYVGTHHQGRQDTADAHRALFDGFVKGARLADSFLAVRFHGPDTAVVTSRSDTYTGNRTGPRPRT